MCGIASVLCTGSCLKWEFKVEKCHKKEVLTRKRAWLESWWEAHLGNRCMGRQLSMGKESEDIYAPPKHHWEAASAEDFNECFHRTTCSVGACQCLSKAVVASMWNTLHRLVRFKSYFSAGGTSLEDDGTLKMWHFIRSTSIRMGLEFYSLPQIPPCLLLHDSEYNDQPPHTSPTVLSSVRQISFQNP